MRKWVLWGHRFSEYQDMFNCFEPLKVKTILEFASGPTMVNAELSAKGHEVVSCDPWFSSEIPKMRALFQEDFDKQLQHMQKHPERFDFNKYGGMETFFEHRKEGFEKFFMDYPEGFSRERYQVLNSPQLPFKNAQFDLAFCSSFLFADLPEQNLDFQLNYIKELARVASDVRIYPLTDQLGKPSTLLGPVLLALQNENFKVEIQEVPFRLVPASKAMLRIQSQRCEL